MSYERALNFDQWKTFSENYKPMRGWLWLVYKFTENYCQLRLFSEFVQTQKRYPASLEKTRILTWKLTFCIKLKLFLWTKLQKNLLLAKYLTSVAAPLTANTSWKIPGICVFRPQPWPTAPICIWRSPPQFVFSGHRPTIRIYRSWLIIIGNNKIQRLHIMWLFYFCCLIPL